MCRRITFDALDKKLKDGKNIDTIAMEMCETVKDGRGKVIRWIKDLYPENYLIENAEKLGYDVSHIKNPKGRKRLNFFNREEQRKYFKKELMNIMNQAFLALPDEVDDIFDEARKEYKGQFRF